MAAKKKPGSATPALRALRDTDVSFAVHEYSHDPHETAFGQEAAKALQLDPDRVFKTLLTDVDGSLVVAILPVSGQLDLKALAAAMGSKKAMMADPQVAERTTGYVVGGISPIGQRKALPTVLDASAMDHATIFVSAGRRGLDVELSPQDLIEVTKARLAHLKA